MTLKPWRRATLFLLVCFLCGWAPQWLPAQTPQGTTIKSSALNLAVFTQGEAAIKRKDRNSYEPVVFGTSLELEDLLKVGASSDLKVVCSDLKLHDLSTGIFGVPCPASQTVLRSADGSLINATRGWANGRILSGRRLSSPD
jgi:hypothetical protein